MKDVIEQIYAEQQTHQKKNRKEKKIKKENKEKGVAK